jgi:hypothetical protein
MHYNNTNLKNKNKNQRYKKFMHIMHQKNKNHSAFYQAIHHNPTSW